MEEKLKEFRRRQRREEIWNTLMLKGVMEKMRSSSSDSPAPEPSNATSPASPITKTPELERSPSEDNISIASSNASAEWSFSHTTVSRLTLATYLLYALLWVTVFLIAIQLRFGAVYVVLSGLVGIYLNTRTGPRKPGEVSAYSVFNPNCEAIDGTLKAEQFEREFNLIHHSPNV